VDATETKFEELIEQALIDQGYRKRAPKDYERERCLDTGLVLDFIQATQPEAWQGLKETSGSSDRAAERLLDRLYRDISEHGTSHVLHKGVKAGGKKFHFVFFPPASTLNEKAVDLARGNIFSVTRQLRYGTRKDSSDRNELDWMIFLNGLPLFPAELKNHLTGQTVKNAVIQWRRNRDAREPLFKQGRCLAFFAVDDDVVQYATHLKGNDTSFFPFNKGRKGGAGNPPTKGYATEYLWKQVFAPQTILALLQHLVLLVDDEDEKGKKTATQTLLFPRYHQMRAVLDAVADIKKKGVGENYLFQHSAGAGKSNTIAWLANLLSILHDLEDEAAFDTVIILTDRKILDRQLQGVLRRFQRTSGVLENITKNSAQLKDALERGKKIIVTTVQKFPVIAEEIGQLPGQLFALIIDEAHSGQGVETKKALKKTLTSDQGDEDEENATDDEDLLESKVAAAMEQRGMLENASVFAFTATPGPTTLQLFGTKQPDGSYRPFSLYTRRQAIEEHYIEDVLKTYFTYESYWRLIKKIDDDPSYDRSKAASMIKQLVSLDDSMIDQKVEIAVEAFETLARDKIGGKAKAMFVCRSRLHAVRVKLAMDRYVEATGIEWNALVAFSDTVTDPKTGEDHTEFSMNGFPDTQTADKFKLSENRFLIVANKFQTGFDQPLLFMMVVDKQLHGANAVQTLERLNRTHPDKDGTLVLDFYNKTDEIKDAFQTFHGETTLGEGTDPDSLHDLETKIRANELFEASEVEDFAMAWFDEKKDQSALHPTLAGVVERYEEADEDDRAKFRGLLTEYVRMYSFLVQIIDYTDTDLEKLYLWTRMALTKLSTPEGDLPVGLSSALDLESLKVKKTGERTLSLAPTGAELDPIKVMENGGVAHEDFAPLSAIIKDLNETFGIDLTDADKITLAQLEQKLDENAGLEKTFDVNEPDDARLSFAQIAERELGDLFDSNENFFKTVANNSDIRDRLMAALFERFEQRRHIKSLPEEREQSD
jgi:type I restriction enzyme, R subunit